MAKQSRSSTRSRPGRLPAKRVCILVLGMHRSGTSAVTRILNLMGARLPAHILGASEGNESGHWESELLYQYNDRLLHELGSNWWDWRPLDMTRLSLSRRDQVKRDIQGIVDSEFGQPELMVLKEPRICRFAGFFIESLEEMGLDVRPLIPFRNPLEVLESLKRRAEAWPEHLSDADAALLWLVHVLEAEKASRGRPRAFSSYEELLEDWRAEANRVAGQLDVAFPSGPDEIELLAGNFISRGLRHHERNAEEVALDPLLRGWVSETYEALLKLRARPANPKVEATLDRIGMEFARAVPAIVGFMQAARLQAEKALGKASQAERQLAERQREFEEHVLRADDLRHAIEAKDQELQERATALDTVRDELQRRLGEHSQEVESLHHIVEVKSRELQERTAALDMLHAGQGASDASIADLSSERDRVVEQIRIAEANLVERDAEIERLSNVVRRLEELVEAHAEGEAKARRAFELHDGDNRDLAQVATEFALRLEQCETELRRNEEALSEVGEQRTAAMESARVALAAAEEDVRKLATELDGAREHMTAAEARLESLNTLEASLAASNARIEQLTSEIAFANAAIDAYTRSRSWRITAPLRTIGRGVKRVARLPGDLYRLRLLPVSRAARSLVSRYGARNVAGRSYQLLKTGGLRGLASAALRAGEIHGDPQKAVLNSPEPQTAPANGPGPQELLDERSEFSIVLGGRPAPAPPADPSIFILSETELSQCVRYRILNKIETLNAMDVRTDYGDPRDIYRSISELQFYRTLIFYRMPMSDLFMIYFDEARRLGMTIGYDLDDPSFDTGVLGANPNLKVIEPHYREGQLRDAVRFRQAMSACDFLTTSTPYLGELMQRATNNPNVYLWRNIADHEALATGAQARALADEKPHEEIVLGYFSGSLAHEADFDEALAAVAEVMEQRLDVSLLVVGHLRDRPEFAKWSDRIRREAFTDYIAYLELVAECDLVVVPLADDAFNKCKSVVRFIDAAVTSTPVVASAVGDYDELLEHGRTAFLVRNRQWRTVLREAVSNAALRKKVGANARQFVAEKFSTDSYRPGIGEPFGQTVLGGE